MRGEHASACSGEVLGPDDGEARCRNFAVILQGPGVGDVHSLPTNSFGGYAFGGLAVGSYRVLSSVADSTLARLGLRFAGLQTGVPVVLDPLSTETVNLPFDIPMIRPPDMETG